MRPCPLLQGVILSGGQKQRISVARALYQQTNVVFLVSRESGDKRLESSCRTAPLIDPYSRQTAYQHSPTEGCPFRLWWDSIPDVTKIATFSWSQLLKMQLSNSAWKHEPLMHWTASQFYKHYNIITAVYVDNAEYNTKLYGILS